MDLTASSDAAAVSSLKRALPPPAAHPADAEASAPQPQPPLHSAVAPPPPKKARKNLLPACAFFRDAEARALTLAPSPSTRLWRGLSPAQRCFTDGLAMAFSFLSLGELILAIAVCSARLTAATKTNIAPATLNNPSLFFQLFWQCIIHKAKRRGATKLIPLHTTDSELGRPRIGATGKDLEEAL